MTSAFPPLPVEEIARNDDVLEALSWLCTFSDHTINQLQVYSFDVRSHGVGLATAFYHLGVIARIVKRTYAAIERDREHQEEHTHSLSTVSSNEEREEEGPMEGPVEGNSGQDAVADDDNVNPFDDTGDIKPFIHLELTEDDALRGEPREEGEGPYDEPHEEEQEPDPPPVPPHRVDVPPPLPPKDHLVAPQLPPCKFENEDVNVVDVEEEAEIDQIVLSMNADRPESSSSRQSRKRKLSKERDGDHVQKDDKKKKKKKEMYKEKQVVVKKRKEDKEKEKEKVKEAEKKKEREKEEKKKKEKEEAEKMQRRRSPSPPHRSPPRRILSPVVEMIKPTEGQEWCAFCRSFAHSSLHCPVHTDFKSRDKMRMYRKLCWHCLGPYDPEVCRQKSHMKRCTNCSFPHLSHPAMCKSYNARSELRKSPERRPRMPTERDRPRRDDDLHSRKKR